MTSRRRNNIVLSVVFGAVVAFMIVALVREREEMKAADVVQTAAALVAVGIAVVGWQVNVRDQERLFLLQVKNGARKEIVAALRGQQDALHAVGMALFRTQIGAARGRAAAEPLTQSVSTLSTRWLLALEQYDLLFVGIRRARGELTKFDRATWMALRDLAGELTVDGSMVDVVSAAKALGTRVTEETLLFEDLLTYIQNESFAEIVGVEAPYRRPKSLETSHRFVVRNNVLVLVDPVGRMLYPPSEYPDTRGEA